MKLSASFKALLCSIAFMAMMSCHNNKDGKDEKVLKCRQFMDKNFQDFQLGKHTHFIEKTDSFIAKSEDVTPNCLVWAYDNKVWYYLNRAGSPDTALLYTDSVLRALAKYDLYKEEWQKYVIAYAAKGEIYYRSDNFDSAFANYFRAKQLAEQSSDIYSQVPYCYGLGMVSYKQKKFHEAINYFDAAFKANWHCSNPSFNQMQELLDNIALCYEKLQMIDSAMYFYDSTLSFIRKNTDHFGDTLFAGKGIGVAYGNIGNVFFKKGQTDSAISYYRRSYEINSRPRYDNADALLVHIKLAKALLKKDDLPSFAVNIRLINKEIETVEHSAEGLKDWNDILTQYYEQTGNIREALRCSKMYATLQDSIFNLERKQLQSDVQKTFKQTQQAYEINTLQKENKVRTQLLWLAIIMLVMTVAIVTLISNNYGKTRRNMLALTLLNNRIVEQKQELEKKNNEKDRILHIVAHDLRNPVGSVLYLANEMRSGNAEAWQKDDVMGMVQRASETAMQLINELLGITNDAHTPLTTELADLASLMRDTLKLLQFKANEKQQTLLTDIPVTPVMANIDQQQIMRVIGNLITNAVKFSKHHSTISCSLSADKKNALMTIRDQGIGIPADLQPEVFNMFTNAKRKGTDGEKSYGLGLSICKQIIDAHGGKIWFESEVGLGTTFYIELPL